MADNPYLSWGPEWMDDPFTGRSACGYGGYSNYRYPKHPHSRDLDMAMYAKWSNDYEYGFQLLGDIYNDLIRKPNERVLLPPPKL